jgi:hypothetical protein
MKLKTSKGETYFNPQLISHVHLSADHSLLTLHFVNGAALGIPADSEADRAGVAEFLGKLAGETSGFATVGSEMLNLKAAFWISIPEEGPAQVRAGDNRIHSVDEAERARVRAVVGE